MMFIVVIVGFGIGVFGNVGVEVGISITNFNPFSNNLCVCSISLLQTLWEKEKSLDKSNFSFSHSVFCSFRELSVIFMTFEIVVCKLSEFGSLKFVVWERVNLGHISVITENIYLKYET